MPKKGKIARRPAWPEDAVFRRLVLECDSCEHCGATLHVCDHRFHRVHTLQSPVELPCRLARCSDCLFPLRCQTLRPPCPSRSGHSWSPARREGSRCPGSPATEKQRKTPTAPSRLPILQVSAPTGSTSHRCRLASAHCSHEQGQPTLGRAAHPGRTSSAGP
jgi:hypothetical protein